MLKLTLISDTHAKHHQLNYDLPGGDILLHAGDFMTDGYSQTEACQFFEWFNKIKTLTESKHNNVKMIFSPPESSAYSENGEELWNIRVPSDYGLESEFATYLETAKRVIENQISPCVIFIDANMRTEILEIAFNSSINHEVLIHDVIPERSYLNLWKDKYSQSIIIQIDSLVHVKRK